MSDQEVDLWERVFICAVSRATSCSISPTAFVEDFLQELHQDKVRVYVQDAAMFFVVLTTGSRFTSKPQLLLCIISHVALTDQDKLPSRTFLVLDHVLHDLYPPSPEHFAISFLYLDAIRAIVTSAPPLFVVPILEALCRSLSRWIVDASTALLEEEYNNIVSLQDLQDSMNAYRNTIGHAIVL
jgi:hypothetical protein